MAKRKAKVPSSPIELLRSGIETGSWTEVAAAYKALTGQEVSVPVDDGLSIKERALKIINQAVATLNGLTQEVKAFTAQEPNPNHWSSPEDVPEGNWAKAIVEHPEILPGRESPEESIDDGKLIAESKKLSKRKVEKSYRPAFQMVKVICAGCGLAEEVHPSLAPRSLGKEHEPSGYRCNRCLTKAR